MKRTEHPNPQFRRDYYKCLNGEWGFQIENVEGLTNCDLNGKINVPFCPESKLSGVAHTDFIRHCMYTKTIFISEEDLASRLVLHFGAVDHLAKIYVNGSFAFEHRGGYTPFEVELNKYVLAGENRISVEVFDDYLEGVCTGKQSRKPESQGCFYTRVTGIWQTVWLEKTPWIYLSKIHVIPDAINGKVSIETYIEGGESDVEVIISYGGKELARETHPSFFRHTFDITLPEIHLWELGKGRLYDLDVKVGDDLVHSYFGLRSVSYEGKKFMINGKCVFQNLVLDQGYYENGIYTAETEEELVRDIDLAMELGYNGARLHQKVFEPRFLYHCDKLGYMVWGEYPSWGFHDENVFMLGKFVEEWVEAVERDYNHPSIISWCPLNESWGNLSNRKRTRDPRIMEAVYLVTKSLDPSRPCIDTSGGQHGRYTDVFDVHTYLTFEEVEKQMQEIENGEPLNFLSLYPPEYAQENLAYDHKLPINISEYGGIAYDKNGEGWGYTAVTSEDDFVNRFIGLVDLIKNSKNISGYCYTQLYDVEQEQNGLLYYNRESKFSKDAIQRIAAANRKTALIEN